MECPKTVRVTVRKSLCLKPTLQRCQYDPVAKVYFRNVALKTPGDKLATKPAENENADDALENFRSPKKIETKVKAKAKKRPRRMSYKEYTYPEGCNSTQEMFASEWKRAGERHPGYLSEDEFVEFQDQSKREALLKNKAKYIQTSSAGLNKNFIEETDQLNMIETKHATFEPIPADTNGCNLNAGEEKTLVESSKEIVINPDTLTCPAIPTHVHFVPPNPITTSSSKKKSDSLRSELRNIKIENVIIADSDLSENEVPSSQLPRSIKVKTSSENSFDESEEFKNSQDLKAEEKSCVKEQPNRQQKIAFHEGPIIVSIPLSILSSCQNEVKKPNSKNEMVASPAVDELAKKKDQLKMEPTSNWHNVEIRSNHNTCPPVKLSLEPSSKPSAKPEWCVEKLSSVLKPSRKNSKAFYCKRSRFSVTRSLRWKIRILKRKQSIRSI